VSVFEFLAEIASVLFIPDAPHSKRGWAWFAVIVFLIVATIAILTALNALNIL